MNNIKDNVLLNSAPDFDNQVKILEEEHKLMIKKRKWYTLMGSILLLIVLIFVISYSNIYVYHEYKEGVITGDNCDYVNIKLEGDLVPSINLTDKNDCKPMYNIDYYHNQKPLFNIDLYGDRKTLFNKMNQMDSTKTYCILNCDNNSDGWPDYNIDLDGDGKADINIVKNPQINTICEINCDLDLDMVADTNIDLDDDLISDINITNGDYKYPVYNIDYKGNRKPVFNVKNNNDIKNPVTDVRINPNCTVNCDLDSDGWPDYNIKLSEEQEVILNELISTENSTHMIYSKEKTTDYKCFFYRDSPGCTKNNYGYNYLFINIDVDGDGTPDVNVSSDGGKTITNKINKIGTYNNQEIIMNQDIDEDGFPENNLDLNNDGIPDMNVHIDNKCVLNCDTNADGKKDHLVPIVEEKHTIYTLNIDYDYDGKCDVNCDLDNDLYPDINLDINKDNIPDINIDFDGDKIADFNIDTNNDVIADSKLDAFGMGYCNFNCPNEEISIVGKGQTCTKNCDINDDGWPEINVDLNKDGICDLNCDNGTSFIDANHDYYLDSIAADENAILNITEAVNSDVVIMNPLSISSNNVEPGWSNKYIVTIKNSTNYAVAYNLTWDDIENNFTDENNLDYLMTRSNVSYLNNRKVPRKNEILGDIKLIKGKTTIRYVLKLSFPETGINQNVDSGKIFRGKFKIDVVQ